MIMSALFKSEIIWSIGPAQQAVRMGYAALALSAFDA
jgi:hypothetical protein